MSFPKRKATPNVQYWFLPGKQSLLLISINYKPLKPAFSSCLKKKMVLSHVFQVGVLLDIKNERRTSHRTNHDKLASSKLILNPYDDYG